jgi:hypothetical protein
VDAEKLSNVGYLLGGYDFFASNPMPTDANPDPGFRSAIFKAEYKGSTTPDNLFCIPDGLSFQSCEDSCQINFDSRIILGRKEYMEGLQVKVSEFDSQQDIVGAFGASKVKSIQDLSSDIKLKVWPHEVVEVAKVRQKKTERVF